MPTTINAQATTGLLTTADGSGIVKLQSDGKTTNALGWINFDGTLSSPITSRASYNFSSVTKNGTGDYTTTFINSLSDSNYVPTITLGNYFTVGCSGGGYTNATRVASSFRVRTLNATQSGTQDIDTAYVAIFGN